MNSKGKEFVVSVADFAFFVNGVLACTGTTNLSSSISVSMEEQAVNAGKGNQKVFSYKYGRELTSELEAADWKLQYIALQTGSQISRAARNFFSIHECVTLTAGVGTLAHTPTSAKVGVELPNGQYVDVTPSGSTIDLSTLGVTTEKVYATYQYNATTDRITIDADTAPCIGELVLQADKHNSKKGKIGTVEIRIPSYALNGNFDISFTPDGVTSTTMNGTALAVEGDTCADGSAVYAYITEKNDEGVDTPVVSDIAIVTPATTLAQSATLTLKVEGIIGNMYAPIELDNSDITFSVASGTSCTVGASTGVVTAGTTAGATVIHAAYGDFEDAVTITVASA
jgi:hypothetical protein